jgi:hypothetical protein
MNYKATVILIKTKEYSGQSFSLSVLQKKMSQRVEATSLVERSTLMRRSGFRY